MPHSYMTGSQMSSLFSPPKVEPLPPKPDEASATETARQRRRDINRQKTQTILTSPLGVTGQQDNQKRKTILGG